ncbi:MAG TPA: hypothetical protein VNK52_17050 [Hyphomicrobiaceae bacterium]|nr:hypothetical protein [Hyphomicrobiaceae bacterium]
MEQPRVLGLAMRRLLPKRAFCQTASSHLARLDVAAFGLFLLAWLVLCAPWLLGGLTIPYDAKAHFYAQLQFLANALHTGQSPFWVPNVFGGAPQIADPQSLIFSPAVLIALVHPSPSFTVVDGYVFALLGCGGLAIMLFFRDRGWHAAGGVVAALAFSFGASAAWRVQHIGQVQSYALFAVTLWLLARAFDRRSLSWGMAAGVAGGLMLVEPNQVALLGAYVLAGFVLARFIAQRAPLSAAARLLPTVASAAVIAAAIAAIPVMLTWLFVESSSRPDVAFAEAVRGSLHPASLLTAVIGDLYGALDPDVEYWGPYSVAWDARDLMLSQNMSQLYIGALPVLLILTAGLVRGALWNREVRYFTIAAVILAGYALGGYSPIFHLLYDYVPGVRMFRRPADATFMIGAVAAILGGYLAHLLMKRALSAAAFWRRWLEVGLLAGVVVLSAAVAYRTGHLAVAAKPIVLAMLWVALAAAAAWLVSSVAPRHALLSLAGLTALMTADLAVNNGPNESTALPAERYEILTPECNNPTIALLKARLKREPGSPRRDRVELVGLGFEWPNAPLVHGFDHVLGYNPLRLDIVSDAVGADDTVAGWDQRRFTPLFPSYRSLLADLLGLRFIAAPVPIERIDRWLRPGDLKLIARTADAFIYENPLALPRAMYVADWQLADFDALIKTGAWPKFDPARTVLLERPPQGMEVPLPLAAVRPPRGQVGIVRYENTLVEIEVLAERAGLVVLNDVWHPWWTAAVDDVPVEIMRANVLFRAVQVPAGRHIVRFQFEPISGAIAELGGALEVH